jgi:hypothetical protein
MDRAAHESQRQEPMINPALGKYLASPHKTVLSASNSTSTR